MNTSFLSEYKLIDQLIFDKIETKSLFEDFDIIQQKLNEIKKKFKSKIESQENKIVKNKKEGKQNVQKRKVNFEDLNSQLKSEGDNISKRSKIESNVKAEGPQTPFLLFSHEFYEEYKRKNLEEILDYSQMSKKCSKRWKSLSGREKEKYQKLASQRTMLQNKVKKVVVQPQEKEQTTANNKPVNVEKLSDQEEEEEKSVQNQESSAQEMEQEKTMDNKEECQTYLDVKEKDSEIFPNKYNEDNKQDLIDYEQKTERNITEKDQNLLNQEDDQIIVFKVEEDQKIEVVEQSDQNQVIVKEEEKEEMDEDEVEIIDLENDESQEINLQVTNDAPESEQNQEMNEQKETAKDLEVTIEKENDQVILKENDQESIAATVEKDLEMSDQESDNENYQENRQNSPSLLAQESDNENDQENMNKPLSSVPSISDKNDIGQPVQNEEKSSNPSSSTPPKKNLPAFFWFCIKERDQVKRDNPDFNPGDIFRELGRRWTSSNPELKEKYEQMAENDKIRYENEFEEYNKENQLEAKNVEKI